MIGEAPKYTMSRFFMSEPTWHLLKEAPKELKIQFELDMNEPQLTELYKKNYPRMNNPFYKWTGKIVDRK